MNPIRIVIADDEPVARARLRRLIGMREDCEQVGEFADGVQLAKGLEVLRADVILLDIDMPGPNGFSSLAMLAEPKPLVVFVTAFAEFAARAFDDDAVDYLMKPVSGERLQQALTKTARRLQLARSADAPSITNIIRFVAQGRTYLFERSKIASVRARGNYVEITTDTQRTEFRMSLKAVWDHLNGSDFVRIHRSWIVARAALMQITSLPGSRYEILLKDGRCVPGGRAFAQSIVIAARGYDADRVSG